jgi:hypothetical protein
MTGVIEGVALGVMEGVAPPGVIEGVAPPGVIDGVAPGVSSHLDLLLLAEGVGVSEMILSPGCTDRGVSAQPAFAVVSLSVLGVSSQRFLLELAPPGVALPACPGVSLDLSLPGVV